MKEFLEKFEEQFDDVVPGSLKAETVFREIEGWSSLTAMLIIAMADAEYDVTITGAEIKESVTIGDLYNIVTTKK